MKVTLLGLEFASANLGCEALAYSFANELSRIAGQMQTKIEYTAVLFETNSNIVIPVNGQKISCLKIRYKSFAFWRNLIKLFKESDLIFDFTGGDSFSDIYGKKRFYMGTIIKKLAICSKNTFVLGPQTYGPYQRKMVKMFAKHVIRKSAYVFARDDVSQKYATELANRDVKIAPDVAFSLPYEKCSLPEKHEKIRIGINPSGLLWNGGYSHAKLPLTVEYREYCETLLEALVKDGRYEIYLISHVGTPNGAGVENDYAVCKQLHQKYAETVLVDVFDTPMEAKTFISGMDILIAARMHATIAAFSSGVATIPFSYSRKFEGLYDSVAYDYVIHACSRTTEEAIADTLKYVEKYEVLKEKATESMKTIDVLKSGFEDELRNLIKDKEKKG